MTNKSALLSALEGCLVGGAVVFGSPQNVIYVKPSLAHGGEEHSRDREKPSEEEVPLNGLEPNEKTDSTTADISSEQGEGLEQPGISESEILIQEALPPPVLPSDTSAFSLGAVGLGEVLFVLIITGPFLLRTLKYRLHS